LINNIFNIILLILSKKKFSITIFIIYLLTISFQPIYAAENNEQKQALIFFSHPLGTPWQDQISKALYEELQGDLDIKVNISADFPWIDTKRDDVYNNLLINFYLYKYSNKHIDIIISTSTASTLFLLEFGDILFPQIPVVALPGPSKEILGQVNQKLNWTGVFSEKKIKETIDLALKLQPKTKNIAVVSGVSANGKILEKYTREILLKGTYPQNTIYLTNMPMNDIISQVSSLPDNTIILYLTTQLDSTGKEFIPKIILKEITAAANAPVYGLWDTILKSGITGGYMVSPYLDGKSLAAITLKVLKGENINNIPVTKARNAYYFNWLQLKKWKIDQNNLPSNSIIINQEYSIWDLYKKQIIAIIAVVLIQALLIIILLILQSRLKLTRKSLSKSQKELESKVIERTKDLTLSNNNLKTEIINHKAAKVQVQSLLKEKELILSEVHHRIKNNMSTTMSLLSLQSANLKNPEAIEALETAENRVLSMMLLYDKLYKGSDFQKIFVTDYFTTLTTEIVQNFENSNRIHIKTEIKDFQMDVKTVFNLGIIINELITNAMKYAFPENKDGKLFLSIENKGKHVLIIIRDNGIGLPDTINFDSPKSFGLSLVKMLIEQLQGTIKIKKGNGTEFLLEIDQK